MKKFFSYILIVLFFLVIIAPVSTSAQFTPPVNLSTSTSGTVLTPVGNVVTSNANSQGSTDKPVDEACGFLMSGSWRGCLNAAFAWITYLILGMMSLLLWLSGTMLDFVLKYTVIDMAAHINGSPDGSIPALTGINVAWKVIRDLMNIAFIFLLVYEGIKMILGIGNKARSLIVGIILASLLINFSLFFTKVIIDASNIVTIGFYNSVIDSNAQINPTTPKGSTVPVTAGAGKISGLSVPFMKALGVTSFYSTEAFSSTFVSDVGGKTNMIIYAIAGSILFIIVSFSFLAVSVMFVIRYIAFLALLMTSPLGFIGIALPDIAGGYSKQWWSTLRSQALFAPVYMLMTWVVLTLLASPGFISIAGQGDWGKLVTGVNGEANASSIGLIFNFVIVIGLIILTLKVAKDTATKGSALIGDATKWATSKAGNAVMGSAAAVGRRTVGAVADRAAQSQRFQNFAGRSVVGERLLRGTRGVASSSFDVRNSTVGRTTASASGVDFGRAQEGGFTRTLQERTSQRETFSRTLSGDAAREAYAGRQASRWYVRGGSNSSANTIFGTMGRSNRVVASRILTGQLTPLEANEQNLTSRENQLSQQLTNMNNEVATLSALATPTPQQVTRLTVLNDMTAAVPPGAPAGTPAVPTNRNSVAYIQYQLTATQTNLARVGTETARIRGLINTNGLVNTDNRPGYGITNAQTGITRGRRADEQNF